MSEQNKSITELNLDVENKREVYGDFLHDASQELDRAIDAGEVRSVYQKGIGFYDGTDPSQHFVETSDFGAERPMFGSCVAVFAWNRYTKKAILLHADSNTDISKAFSLMNHHFDGDQRVEISIVGGLTGQSESTINSIVSELKQKPDWQVKRFDILGAAQRQVAADTQSGDVYVLYSEARRHMKPWQWWEQPESVQHRMGAVSSNMSSLIDDSEL